jgi:ZIP family zinc transporter
MFAASIWSLIIPSIELAEAQEKPGWIAATVGILLGTLFLMSTDIWAEKILKKHKKKVTKKTGMLGFAITLHNIPEGMAVGIVIASSLTGNFGVEFTSALALSIGIAIQNFPEGMAISLPYKAEGYSNKKAFIKGMLSGIVEPIAAVITILISNVINSILPYLLSFAAGSMLYVIICELIPDSQEGEYSRLATIGVFCGFLIMMILDVTLG